MGVRPWAEPGGPCCRLVGKTKGHFQKMMGHLQKTKGHLRKAKRHSMVTARLQEATRSPVPSFAWRLGSLDLGAVQQGQLYRLLKQGGGTSWALTRGRATLGRFGGL